MKKPHTKSRTSCGHEEVLFLFPAKITRPFFTRLYAECEKAIFKEHGARFRPILRAISETADQFDPSTVTATLERELAYEGKIKTVVVCPTESIQLSIDMRKLSEKHKLRLIALTLPFRRWAKRSESLPREQFRPPVVISKTKNAIEELAKAAASHPSNSANEVVSLVVAEGPKSRVDSFFRCRMFKAYLELYVKKFCTGIGVEPPYSETDRKGLRLPRCNWSREDARKHFISHFASFKKPPRVDILFAANDEMALGIRAAALELVNEKKYSESIARMKIFGCDGIPEAISLIRSGDPFFCGTVRQDHAGLASKLAEIIGKSETTIHGRVFSVLPKVEIKSDLLGKMAGFNFPNIPKLEHSESGGRWIRASDFAKMLSVKPGTLKDYRKPSRGAVSTKDSNGMLGKDCQGNIWRKDAYSGKFYYFNGLGAAE